MMLRYQSGAMRPGYSASTKDQKVGALAGFPQSEAILDIVAQGEVVSISHNFSSATSGSVGITFTNDAYDYLAWTAVSTGVEASVEIYYGAVFSGGTSCTISNRRSGDIGFLSAVYAPTVTNTGTLIAERYIGAAKGSEAADIAPRIYSGSGTALIKVTLASNNKFGVVTDIARVPRSIAL